MTIHDAHNWVHKIQEKTGVSEKHVFFLLARAFQQLDEPQKPDVYFFICRQCEDIWYNRKSVKDFEDPS